jgi:type VI protein secretion system component VasF
MGKDKDFCCRQAREDLERGTVWQRQEPWMTFPANPMTEGTLSLIHARLRGKLEAVQPKNKLAYKLQYFSNFVCHSSYTADQYRRRITKWAETQQAKLQSNGRSFQHCKKKEYATCHQRRTH